jgi:hypothetical protein
MMSNKTEKPPPEDGGGADLRSYSDRDRAVSCCACRMHDHGRELQVGVFADCSGDNHSMVAGRAMGVSRLRLR